MNIVFYSNNSNYFDSSTFLINTIPSWKNQFEELQKNHPNDNFYAVTQEPGMFLTDSSEIKQYRKNLILYKTDDTSEIVEIIKELKPDIAIALSFWTNCYDWLPVKDSLIGEQLEKNGIKAIYHPVSTTSTCFNKKNTNDFLLQNSFNCANSLFVNHDLYFSADSKKDVRYNVYKEAVFNQISKMKLPLIIKDPLGLSSYGMQVVNTYGEAKAYFNSKKNNSDRIIEEFIDGEQFGCEIYGFKGNYTVFPPFKFSVNQYGITSPKQSVKFGPYFENDDFEKYRIQDLQDSLKLLAEKLNFCGFAQVDLVFNDKKWYILEINPRLSGMTTSYCASLNMNFYEMILHFLSIDLKKDDYCHILEDVTSVCNIDLCFDYTLNIKFQPLPTEVFLRLSEVQGVRFCCQTEDIVAKQTREIGYCEVIISDKSKSGLLKILEKIEKDFSDYAEPAFFKTAKEIIKL